MNYVWELDWPMNLKAQQGVSTVGDITQSNNGRTKLTQKTNRK